MELTYALMHETGVDALDPDNAPPGVALRMEYTTFCQARLPHLTPENGKKVLEMYGLESEYDEVKQQPTDHHNCGMCGSVIETMPGAKQVVCENCGFTIDVGSEALKCGKCGSMVSLPVSVSHVICPYCSTVTHRV